MPIFWQTAKTRGVAFCLLVGCALVWVPVPAEDLTPPQIQAAYVYNFAKFTEWPAQAVTDPASLALCLLGKGPANDALEALAGRKVGERTLVVSRRSADDDLTACRLLFIAESESQRFLVTVKALANQPILLISDIEDFAAQGGTIGLLWQEDRMVFEVNLDAVRLAGLRLPGQLLNIASQVYGK